MYLVGDYRKPPKQYALITGPESLSLFTAQYVVCGAKERGIVRETQFLPKARRWRHL